MRIFLPQKTRGAVIIVASTLATMVSYEVRALMAALMIFSVAFVGFGTAFLILALVLRGIRILIRVLRVGDGRSPILRRADFRV